MNFITGFLILALACQSLSAQTNIRALKLSMVKEVIDTLVKRQERNSPKKQISVTCLINTRYRDAHFSTGAAGEYVYYSEYKNDSNIIYSLSNAYSKSHFLFAELDGFDTYRDLTVKSSSFAPGKACNSDCIKLYIEIGTPVEGWDNIHFYSLTVDQVIGDKPLMKYNVPQLSIPIFIYQHKDSKEKIEKYIYTFNILTANNRVSTVLKAILKLYPLQ